MYSYKTAVVITGDDNSANKILEQRINDFVKSGYTLDSFSTVYIGNVTFPTERYTHFLILKKEIS